MRFEQILEAVLDQNQNRRLYPGLWSENGVLDSKVADNLNQIADDFIEEHDIPRDAIRDITITGSMANYNWTKHSDIDLHILVNFDQVDDSEELLNDYFKLAKTNWNNKHDIIICDHEVEIYVQDAQEPHHSTGVYSLQDGEWIEQPSKSKMGDKPDPQAVNRKTKKIINKISRINIKDQDAQDQAAELMDDIKEMRMEGLRSDGENSLENLVFKNLRNYGHLDKLTSIGTKSYDQQLSIDDCGIK
jgi:predicted nucleotidyltransferase